MRALSGHRLKWIIWQLRTKLITYALEQNIILQFVTYFPFLIITVLIVFRASKMLNLKRNVGNFFWNYSSGLSNRGQFSKTSGRRLGHTTGGRRQQRCSLLSHSLLLLTKIIYFFIATFYKITINFIVPYKLNKIYH